MKSSNIKQLVTMSLLVAIMIVFNYTSLGFLSIGVVSITFMCLPIIIGTLALGLLPGLVLGFLFACFSLLKAIQAPDALFALIIAQTGLLPLIPVIFFPRLLIPVFTWFVSRALRKKGDKLRYALAAFTGSMTNTVFFLGMLYLMWGRQVADFFGVSSPVLALAPIGGIVLSNGVPEAIAAVLLCVPVMVALKKQVLRKT